jgi:hypothetical protein
VCFTPVQVDVRVKSNAVRCDKHTVVVGGGEAVNVVTGEVTPPGEPLPPVQDDLVYWTHPELRDECARRGLKVSGNKSDLIARIQADDEASE